MDSQMLLKYYNNLFPFELIYKFLQSTPNREFTITLQNNVYVRALSFKNSQEFKSFVIKKLPVKIDIGPIYKTTPEQGAEMVPYRKELIFDIDLTDYHRKCCEGKNICNKCFKIIKCAAKIMKYLLIQYFGYKDILYVFSGGRGLHIWVSDLSAQHLNDRERKYLVEMIVNIGKNPDQNIVKICDSYKSYFEDQEVKEAINDKSLLKYLYVKLDKNVTAETKHLLKCPFAIHPTSFRISVPINVDEIDNIDITNLPTLESVINEPQTYKKYQDFFDAYINN